MIRTQFDLAYLDVPWPYSNRLTSNGRTVFGQGADGHYDTMSWEDLIEMGHLLNEILADTAVIHSWVTGPHMPNMFWLADQWGWEYSTKSFCWFKVNKDGDKFRQLPGQHTASNTEDCLIFTYRRHKRKDGQPVNKVTPGAVGGQKMVPQVTWQWADEGDYVLSHENGATVAWPYGTIAQNSPLREHSRKPDEVAARLEQMYPNQRKIELFCRYPRKDWTALGNDLDGMDIRVALRLAKSGFYKPHGQLIEQPVEKTLIVPPRPYQAPMAAVY